MSYFLEVKKVKPFLKWAGGKGQLIPEIDSRLPKDLLYGNIKRYIEPFIGGGAIFFHLAQKYECVEEYFINDTNRDLVNCYITIKNCVEDLVEYLGDLQSRYYEKSQEEQKKFFYEIREKFNETKNAEASVAVTAMLLFLNRTCFNGLYRVNRKGKYNVPFGKYRNPTICNSENLRGVSALLQNATILCGDFEECSHFINSETFVYFDPPYRPISKTASFTSYSKDDFTENDQFRLARFCKTINEIGAKFLLSNSDPKNENPEDNFFEANFSNFIIERVKASRAINCKGKKRGKINEIIVTNYESHS